MTNKKSTRFSQELHPKAKRLLERYLNQYEQALLRIASVLARQKDDEAILCNHIANAAQNLSHKESKSARIKQLILAIGSALLGACLQSFITELVNGNSPSISIHTILGFAGIILIFVGDRK